MEWAQWIMCDVIVVDTGMQCDWLAPSWHVTKEAVAVVRCSSQSFIMTLLLSRTVLLSVFLSIDIWHCTVSWYGTYRSKSRGLLIFKDSPIYLQRFHFSTPGVCDICLSVCLSVCQHPYLRNYVPKLHWIFSASHLWPWRGHPLAALRYLMYFRFPRWRHTGT